MSATLTPHTPAAITTITLFLFQMAKLEDCISTNFGKIFVTRRRRKLTCGARSIAKTGRRSGTRKPRAQEHQDKRPVRWGSGEREGCLPKSKWRRPCQWNRGWSVRVRKVDAVQCTHLAVDRGCDVESHHVEDYNHEGGQARSGVDLSKGQIQTRTSWGNSN
jgi:hypothetical protein